MKKLFIGIIVLLSTSLMFAETSFWGIPFGKTEKEVKNIERELESTLQEELKAYGGYDLTIGYGTDKENKVQSIKFSFSLKGDSPVKIKSVLGIYLIEKLGCMFVDGTYYNNSIIASFVIIDNSCTLYVSNRNAFESAISKF